MSKSVIAPSNGLDPLCRMTGDLQLHCNLVWGRPTPSKGPVSDSQLGLFLHRDFIPFVSAALPPLPFPKSLPSSPKWQTRALSLLVPLSLPLCLPSHPPSSPSAFRKPPPRLSYRSPHPVTVSARLDGGLADRGNAKKTTTCILGKHELDSPSSLIWPSYKVLC